MEYIGSEAYKSVMSATAEQLRRRKPYTAAAIAYWKLYNNADSEVWFYKAELDLIEKRLAEMEGKTKRNCYQTATYTNCPER
jgi:hypothetical protein